jgi:hypothetical protein
LLENIFDVLVIFGQQDQRIPYAVLCSGLGSFAATADMKISPRWGAKARESNPSQSG